jgi:uncharacterized membrane protein
MANPGRARGRGVDQPIDTTRGIRPAYDSERFGRLSERVARYIGSWAFIAWMTVVIIAWVSFNVFAPEGIKPDAYPFIFLTLLLSLQASYAAPLILLAQNRQTDRDRVQYQEDRSRNERMLADSDYLAREVAALRSSLGELATRDYVRSELREALDQIMDRLDALDTERRADEADHSVREIAASEQVHPDRGASPS